MSAGDWKDMYRAALAGNLALVRYHIEAGVNPNYQHPEIMSTPLVASLLQGHAEVALYLLEHGADPALLSEYDGLTPLQAARQTGAQPLVDWLVQRGVREPQRPWWRRWLPA